MKSNLAPLPWIQTFVTLLIIALLGRWLGIFGNEGVCLAVVVGEALDFGVADDKASLVTQKTSVNNKVDIKEARDKDGEVVAVALFNKTSDVSVEGLGTPDVYLVDTLALGTVPVAAVSTVYVTEISGDEDNENFQRATIKGKAWENV